MKQQQQEFALFRVVSWIDCLHRANRPPKRDGNPSILRFAFIDPPTFLVHHFPDVSQHALLDHVAVGVK